LDLDWQQPLQCGAPADCLDRRIWAPSGRRPVTSDWTWIEIFESDLLRTSANAALPDYVLFPKPTSNFHITAAKTALNRHFYALSNRR
jgi:hypothetical protein